MKKKFLLVLIVLFTMVVNIFIGFKSIYAYTSGTKTIKKNIKVVIEPNNKSNNESDIGPDNESNNDNDK